jgi:predicted transcriptional regulator
MRRKKKSNVKPTSLLSYCQILESLGERQALVYSKLRQLKSANSTMIAKELNLPINCVVPRIKEMRDMGIIYQHKKDICKITGKLTIFWKPRLWNL